MVVVSGILAEAFKYNTMPLFTLTVGLTLSKTVTNAFAEFTFPLTSVMVKVTLFAPTLVQLKLVLLKA